MTGAVLPETALTMVGPEGAAVLVFVHGSRVTRALWTAVVGRLADRYRCVSIDLPGHGALADRSFTLEGAADLVDAAIDAAGGGPAVLVGLSLGGYVAMTVAARRPERVRGLVLAGSSAEPRGATGLAFRAFASGLEAVPERRLDAFTKWLFRRRYPPEIAEPIVATGDWPRAGAAAVRALTSERFHDRLIAFGGPILVLNGGRDVIFRMGERTFLKDVPNVTRRVLPLASHLTPLDDPEAFSKAVAAFVSELAP